jgi:hypothetical protein
MLSHLFIYHVFDNQLWLYVAMLLTQRLIFHHAYVMHSAISYFHVSKLPNDI